MVHQAAIFSAHFSRFLCIAYILCVSIKFPKNSRKREAANPPNHNFSTISSETVRFRIYADIIPPVSRSSVLSREKKLEFARNERNDSERSESGRIYVNAETRGKDVKEEEEEKKDRERRERGRKGRKGISRKKKRNKRGRGERPKREVSRNLARPLRYDNISRAPGETSSKESRRHPATKAPRRRPPLSEILRARVRERRSADGGGEEGGGRSREKVPRRLSFSLGLARKTREILNKTRRY